MTHIFGAVAWLVALAWVYKCAEAAVGYPKVPNLALPWADLAGATRSSLVVIVPARNEQEDIADCLESLLRQEYTDLHIIAVDDRSTDATGAIMDWIAAHAAGRLDVLHIKELPAGWLGKTHALATAAQMAIKRYDPDYLLFTDGDVVFDPSILRRTLAYVAEVSADHFVVMPTTIAKTWREAAILSFLQVSSLWAMRPWRVSDPNAKRDAVGIGAFNLVSTAAYRQIGGFEAAPMEVLEDLFLGRRIKWSGLRQGVAIAPGMVTVHWAAGAMGLVRGLTKNIFAVFRLRPMFLLAAASGILLNSVAPVAFIALPATRIAGILALAVVFGVYSISSRASRISPLYAAFFPFAGLVVVYAMLRSMFVTLCNRGIIWRGTFYPLDELQRGMVRPRK